MVVSLFYIITHFGCHLWLNLTLFLKNIVFQFQHFLKNPGKIIKGTKFIEKVP